MDELHFAETLAAHVEANPDLARTIVDHPNATIEPKGSESFAAAAALDALKRLGGTLSGRIDLYDTLGEGGMGIVHLGTQTALGRQVAVKTLRQDTREPDAAIRILREAWVTGVLEHPNIVPVHDLGVDKDGAPIIVMKRIEGCEWARLMHDSEEVTRRFGTSDRVEWNLRILLNVCNAVHFAHSRGILHRDLKPENVMVGEFGEVYVLDWGLAVSLKEDVSGRLPLASHAKEIAGTPHYMAPEMLLGDPTKLSPRTDVYLLGAMFFEIFSGHPPHRGETVREMFSDVLLSSPRFGSNFPQEAKQICTMAMSRDPDARYPTVETLRKAVEEYLRHRGSRRLAHEARKSLTRLKTVIADEHKGEERDLAIAHLLGECRFGYHAALSAWPDNTVAREGLDQALLLVIEQELDEGHGAAAATLLRDVAAPPAELAARVEESVRARNFEEERLRKLEEDHDPRVGSRTRTILGAGFGLSWTSVTAFGWLCFWKGWAATYFWAAIFPSLIFLAIGFLSFQWAKQTLTRTLLNRRISQTLAAFLLVQTAFGVGGYFLAIPWPTMHVLYLVLWAISYALVGVWAEKWFLVPAAACTISFLIACAFRSTTYALMTADNLIFTFLIVKLWFPKQDLELIQARRRELRRRARRWLRPTLEGE
jgi:eukaryotic-like serine/threonine-protein kinase